MATSRPTVTFEVVFEGRHIHPEVVSINHLSRTFSAVQRLAAGHDLSEDDKEKEVSEGSLSLLKVRRGSAGFQLSSVAPKVATENLRLTGMVLNKPERLGENEYILSPIEELSTIARSLMTVIVLKEPGKAGVVLARIMPTSYATITESILLSGDTSIIGTVERVGGATEMKCGLRVSGRTRMLICNISSNEAARSLGQKLYEEVTVNGKATWLKTNWRILGFEIKEVFQPRLGAADDMFQALRKAGGSDWDSIEDPKAFLQASGKKP